MSSEHHDQWPDDDSMDVGYPPDADTEEDQQIPKDEEKELAAGKGVPLSDLQRSCGRWGPPPRPYVIPSSNHTVLFKLPWRPGEVPTPYPSTPCDRWDQEHVRMPNSSESLYPVQETEDEKGLRLRWELVQEALLRTILNSHQLETAILSFNSRYNERWNFRALHSLFNDVLDKEETDIFFKEVLPSMVVLALQLPELLTGPIPLLRKHKSHSLSLSQIQIGSLLANAFFCTFPRRNSTKRGSEYSSYPDINFNRLFQSGDSSDSNSIVEKLKCILNYFRRICLAAPTGTVTFSRRHIPTGSLPDWSKSTKPLPKMHIRSNGCIEDEGAGMLQVDFANKFIGGGVLGWGCVQEEIRFVVCPELIVSRLFTECLDATEALLMVGCERFNMYSGYGHSFEWVGDYKDGTPLDSAGRRHCSIVAMDALCFSNTSSQYTAPNLLREVNKAYVGFCEPEDHTSNKLAPVATGNWGCGAFRGDPHLKALLQLMAAGESGRALVYFTFGDENLRDRIFAMYQFLLDNNVTVGKLWGLLNRFSKTCSSSAESVELYEFLYVSAGEDVKCKEISSSAAKLKGSSEKSISKPISSGSSFTKSSLKSCIGNDTKIGSSVDVDSLIEEFDSDTEEAPGPKAQGQVKPKKKSEPTQESSTSCLDLIEESLLKDVISKKQSALVDKSQKSTTLVKAKLHVDSAAGSASGSTGAETVNLCGSAVKTEEIVLSGSSIYSQSDEIVCLDKRTESERHDKAKNLQDPCTPVDQVKAEVSRSSQRNRSSASKRKISDYFSPMQQ